MRVFFALCEALKDGSYKLGDLSEAIGQLKKLKPQEANCLELIAKISPFLTSSEQNGFRTLERVSPKLNLTEVVAMLDTLVTGGELSTERCAKLASACGTIASAWCFKEYIKTSGWVEA